MKSDNPKEDLNMLGCLIHNAKFKHEALYTPEESKLIREKFFSLFKRQNEQF